MTAFLMIASIVRNFEHASLQVHTYLVAACLLALRSFKFATTAAICAFAVERCILQMFLG